MCISLDSFCCQWWNTQFIFFFKSEMGNFLLMKETPETSFGVGFATQGVLAELRNPLYSATLQGEGSILRLYKLFCGQLQ